LIYFIVNPSAGSGRALKAVPVVEKIMREKNADYKIVYTSVPRDFERVSGLIDIETAQSVVCLGGDGTIQEYVGLAAGKDISFGIIPAGSGNDALLSIPSETPSDAKQKFSNFEEKIAFYTEKVIRNKTVYTDVILINKDKEEKYFFNIAGTGIDIEVLKGALPLKRFLGGAAYFISLIKNVFTYKSMEMTLTVDGTIETGKYTLMAVCNGAYYGGGLKVAPPAVMNDGLITLCKIKNMPKLKMTSVFPLVKSGGHAKLKEVSFVNCSSVKLEFDGIKTINLDGNLPEFESPVTFDIVKNAVKFIV